MANSDIYVNTPIVDFYLGIWEPVEVRANVLDEEITLHAGYHQRPDLLSFDTYGTVKYWWVFMARNKDIIFDPIDDFVAGLTIRIPSRDNIG